MTVEEVAASEMRVTIAKALGRVAAYNGTRIEMDVREGTWTVTAPKWTDDVVCVVVDDNALRVEWLTQYGVQWASATFTHMPARQVCGAIVAGLGLDVVL